jgi:dihydroxyacid dehydratase/phosphogluconate dehydratase
MQRLCSVQRRERGCAAVCTSLQHCLTVLKKNNSREFSNCSWLMVKMWFIKFRKHKSTGNIQILYGNLATEGCVAKISGNEGEYFEGDAIVYENEHVIKGVRGGEVKPGNVVVIRYCGPSGPGMPEMLKPSISIMRSVEKCCFNYDGRFSRFAC